jgi:hypothetical protein
MQAIDPRIEVLIPLTIVTLVVVHGLYRLVEAVKDIASRSPRH